METIAVFVDDAAHARTLLAPMLDAGQQPVRWVVVGCAPAFSHRIARWVSTAGREQWRDGWMADLRQALEPLFAAGPTPQCEWLLAPAPLDGVGARLRSRFGTAVRLLDARQPRFGADAAPLQSGQPAAAARWTMPVAVSSGLAVVLALTD